MYVLKDNNDLNCVTKGAKISNGLIIILLKNDQLIYITG